MNYVIQKNSLKSVIVKTQRTHNLQCSLCASKVLNEELKSLEKANIIKMIYHTKNLSYINNIIL